MHNRNLTTTSNNWQEQIAQLQAELDDLLPQLVDAEAVLSERYAAINAFEFRLRAAIAPLISKLDALDEEVRSLRHKLRRHGDEWFDADLDAATWAKKQRATTDGEYRYRQAPTQARPHQDAETRAALKKLYRQLARRFHPDMAVDAEDREYRTQIMMAINAAYAAGDLAKLKELAASPEAMHVMDSNDADQKLAERLLREVTRIKRRLQEIEQELAHLEKHDSARMMKEQAEAEANGRDYFAEIQAQVRDRLTEKMVIRDGLLAQVESLELGYDTGISDDEFAEIVAEYSRESAWDDEVSPDFDPYILRRTDRIYFEEDFDDDINFE